MIPVDLQPPPAIVLIILDDVGIEHLSTYGIGDTYAETPVLSALAERGQVYTSFWAMPACSPTRASLYTGLYPFRHGVGTALGNDTEHGLPLVFRTLPVWLPNMDVTLFGKWHIGMGEMSGGLDAPSLFGFTDSAATARNLTSYFNWTYVEDGSEHSEQGYATSWVTDTVRGGDLLVAAYHSAHAPLHCPPGAVGCVGGNNMSMYRAMITNLDYEIGRLLSRVGDGALVIVVGDNGSPAPVTQPPFDKGRVKGSVYQGGVNVPLIIAGPGVVPGRVDSNVSVVDLLPTIMELTGNQVPVDTFDGRSFVPLLADPAYRLPQQPIWTELFGPPGSKAGEGDFWYRAARAGNYKLIRGHGAEQLYNLAQDPYEHNDLLGGPLGNIAQTAYDFLTVYMDGLENDG